MSYQNGGTALQYVADELDAGIKSIDASLEDGFKGCPPEGVRFHNAIGRVARAGAMWDGIQVKRAIEAEKEHKRRSYEQGKNPLTTTFKIDSWLGKIDMSGPGIAKACVVIVAFIVIGGIALTNQIKMNQMEKQLTKIVKVVE